GRGHAVNGAAPEPTVAASAALTVAEVAPVLRQLPFAFAQHHGVLLDLANARPDAPLPVLYRPGLRVEIIAELRRALDRPLAFAELTAEQFQQRLTQSFQRDNREAVQMAEDMGADIDLSRLAEEIQETGDLMDAEDDAPVIRLINAILSQAVREKASDIHIETFEDRLVVRYRVDGVLTEVLSPKRMLAPLLVSRLKVMAKLDIAEKRVPQDGRI